MYLDIYDKLYSFGFTDERVYSVKMMQDDEQQILKLTTENVNYPPSSYFTRKELVGLVGKEPEPFMLKEDKYEINGFPCYMYWRF